ncbi:sulfurtransferase complex subunit TusD [Flavobacterium sp. W21_SRS_FM6]|uniref:sulfurtransferase complex subunit TusD n=1 Tax=Flavobacterium sp. W21_SRS_FM6 TaxID=3240268 RepID=UPI003F920715
MATISLLITSAPLMSQSAHSALRFAQTVVQSEHTLQGVFFYSEGVHNANGLQLTPSDEYRLYAAWCELALQHGCPLLVCVTAATKRGILSIKDAKENDLNHTTLEAPFQSVGLGELSELIHSSDRLIQF